MQTQMFFNVPLENQTRINFNGINNLELLNKILISGRNYLCTAHELYYQIWTMDRKIPILLLQLQQLVYCLLEAGKFFKLDNLTFRAMQTSTNMLAIERFLFIKRYPHLANEVINRIFVDLYYALPEQGSYTDLIIARNKVKNSDLLPLREHVRMLTETIKHMRHEQGLSYENIAIRFSDMWNQNHRLWLDNGLNIKMMIQPLLDTLRVGNFSVQWNKNFPDPKLFRISGERFLNKEEFNGQWLEIEQ
ncbi:MAG: hypothetical protein FJ333_10885 [Sphingomonadales bacterium]|nr:hypothetical protein [Sphingomonadales bacterium]